jgi:hypothetical protein
MNILGGKINKMKRNTEALIRAIKDIGVEVNVD